MLKKYSFLLKDLDCANCANKIQNKLAENKDYNNVNVNFNTLKLTLETDVEKEKLKEDLVVEIAKLEPEVEVISLDEISKKYEFILKNLDCANCANKIQNKLAENKDYNNVNVNFSTLKLTLETAQNYELMKNDIIKQISNLEPEVEVIDSNNSIKQEKKSKLNFNALRLIVGILLFAVSMICTEKELISFSSMILAYCILLFRTTKNSIKLLKKKTIDENFLVTVSCIGAYFVGEQVEGLMVIILYEIGKLLEDKAVNNTRKSIADLMDIKPEYANLKHSGNEEDDDHNHGHEHEHNHNNEHDEHEQGHNHSHEHEENENYHLHKVKPEELNLGDIILVKQGEKIPVDGIIISGEAALNTSSLTGESKLQEVKVGDKVLSGSISEKGLLEIKVTEKYENSTVNKILELVENATDKKAKTETFVNKASRIYTPIVVICAILVATVLPLIANVTYSESIYRALIFLVVSCPCAIVISVPLSYFSGIGKASKKGILIKGSNYLDALRFISDIAFDKTGTLTKGEFGVEKIVSYTSKYTENDILEFAAIGESYSNHPLALAILNKYEKKINNENVSDFKEIAGKGLEYKFGEKIVKIGNKDLVDGKQENEIGTIIYVKIDDEVVGFLVLNDSVKIEAKDTIKSLKSQNINTVMFTGDNGEIAKKVGENLEMNTVKAEMLPQDKYNEMEKLIVKNKNSNKKVAFVGDGINDSPVLALSDIGISMGGIGSSSAIEASDVVIMTDDLRKIEEAINISKITSKIIKQNLIFALTVKLLVLILSVLGLAQMWMAVFADVGVTLITILNTIRILRK